MAISAEEVNYLVYRYLQESGFVHSSFTFSYESLILKSSIAATQASQVPPGALISFVQKGLLYLQVEQQLSTESHSGEELRTASDRHGVNCESAEEVRDVAVASTSLLTPPLWETMLKTQAVRYAGWSVKFDKNRDEDEDDDPLPTDEPDAKRKRRSLAVTPVTSTGHQTSSSTDRSSHHVNQKAVEKPQASSLRSASTSSHDLQHSDVESPAKGFYLPLREHMTVSTPGTIPSKCSVVNSVSTQQEGKQELPRGNSAPKFTPQPKHLSAPFHQNQNTHMSLIEQSQCTAHRFGSESNVLSEDVAVLSGHSAEVFCCAWHPSDDILASGSGDSTVRLWDLRLSQSTEPTNCKVLECPQFNMSELTVAGEDRDVTTLEWSANGLFLATGCMDGVTRVWTREGELKHFLSAHSESIFSLRFNDCGRRLLTGSYDKCISVWDVATGRLETKFEAHSAQVLDVDWKHGPAVVDDPSSFVLNGDDEGRGLDVFASCSTDRTIAVCAIPSDDSAFGASNEDSSCLQKELDKSKDAAPHDDSPATMSTNVRTQSQLSRRLEHSNPRLTGESDESVVSLKGTKPIQILSGHVDEVNAIRWDPSGSLLASCSDDRSVMLWRLGLATPIRRFREHSEEIYTIRWSPTGPGTRNPSAPLRLASASFDATVKLWDAEAGVCAHTLKKHDKKVYTIAFSPCGELLASGSLGGQVNIWSVRSGVLLKTFLAASDFSASNASHAAYSGIQSAGDTNTVASVSVPTSSSDIFEVAWNAAGTRLAATSTNAVTIIDIHKMAQFTR